MAHQHLIEPKQADLVPVRRLAAHLQVTEAAVYAAVKRGWLPVVRTGQQIRMRRAAFEWHAANGYGPGVPLYGSEAAGAA